MNDIPARWDELSQAQKRLVERYIDTLLAQQLEIPLQEKPNREVVDRQYLEGVSYQLEKVKCGKDCKGCPHGPYWYAYYRSPHGKVVSKYVGKELKKLPKPYVTEAPGPAGLLHKSQQAP